jgi:hypothetical protein
MPSRFYALPALGWGNYAAPAPALILFNKAYRTKFRLFAESPAPARKITLLHAAPSSSGSATRI